ncbi:Isochorismatase hydrolase [Lentinula aff. detonsa]|uniref:Isochorismatase hydrolase n=1 Tax=Lentinula aff. detonsa TaxID=2804958 RepID=A0AA38U136_9AGAR|nr:Isochorismatase hydrolase [Lentinula aff. detonsa]
MSAPHVSKPVEFGDPKLGDFCVEYPNGLVDLSRSNHLDHQKPSDIDTTEEPGAQPGSSVTTPPLRPGQLDIPVTGDKTVRLDTKKTAFVIIDMQNFFLHQDIRDHPKGLACVDPLMKVVPFFRDNNIKILWVNWGLGDDELNTIPSSLARGFNANHGNRGFGSKLRGEFGRVLIKGEKNTELYGPLQGLFEDGRDRGTDFWIYKNRMSGLWNQTPLEHLLKENGIRTLLFAGVYADDCVLGTIIDANHKGYDCILVEDTTATTSPDVTYEAVLYNTGNTYGFVTSTDKVLGSK